MDKISLKDVKEGFFKHPTAIIGLVLLSLAWYVQTIELTDYDNEVQEVSKLKKEYADLAHTRLLMTASADIAEMLYAEDSSDNNFMKMVFCKATELNYYNSMIKISDIIFSKVDKDYPINPEAKTSPELVDSFVRKKNLKALQYRLNILNWQYYLWSAHTQGSSEYLIAENLKLSKRSRITSLIFFILGIVFVYIDKGVKVLGDKEEEREKDILSKIRNIETMMEGNQNKNSKK